jgi:lactate dehydrogenase-like 2-hydroxyacid dehydrogenase
MAKLKAIVTRRWPEEVERKLGELFDVRLNKDDKPMSVAELQEALRTADVVMPTVSDRITAEVLSAEPMRCKILGNFGVGFNHIDIKAARERGVAVTNTPAVLTDCTADIAMTLLLMAARRAGEGERHVRTKAWTGWRPTHMMATKVTGKTLGLLGLGRIGKAMAKRAHHGFDMPVLFHDPYLKDGTITAAGLDVYEFEPKVSEELLTLENVVLLPHLGSASLETRVAMGMRVIDNVTAFFEGKAPGDRVA